jgi:hypothetical protein
VRSRAPRLAQWHRVSDVEPVALVGIGVVVGAHCDDPRVALVALRREKEELEAVAADVHGIPRAAGDIHPPPIAVGRRHAEFVEARQPLLGWALAEAENLSRPVGEEARHMPHDRVLGAREVRRQVCGALVASPCCYRKMLKRRD